MNILYLIEAVNEIITEYEEVINLAKWRKDVLIKGKNLKRNQKELDRIASILEESGYYVSLTRKDIEMDVREFFRNM